MTTIKSADFDNTNPIDSAVSVDVVPTGTNQGQHHDMDECVSLQGLAPEDVLRALLNTPSH